MEITAIFREWFATAIAISCLFYCIKSVRKLKREKNEAKKAGIRIKMRRVSKVHDRSSLVGDIEVSGIQDYIKEFVATYEYIFEGRVYRVKVKQESSYFENEKEEIINTATGLVETKIQKKIDFFLIAFAISLGLSVILSFFAFMGLIGLFIL